jgi:hypothetical protein
VRKTAIALSLGFVAAFIACGDGLGDVTSGGPSGTPTPTATATPTPTPTPAATPTPGTGTASCQFSRLPNCDATCCSAGGSVDFRPDLESWQAELRDIRPGLFQSNGDVRDNIEYMAALAQHIQFRSQGRICAEPLGHDEIRIKGSQNKSQHVDVLISDRTPWIGGAYTCFPASF